ncbi:MAG: hypothetical protein HY646_12515 [Acidobacteria bacterium]|nr:hypothetical protein [Acidobacteriota bacterium]
MKNNLAQNGVGGFGQTANPRFVTAVQFDSAEQISWVKKRLHKSDLIDADAKKKFAKIA